MRLAVLAAASVLAAAGCASPPAPEPAPGETAPAPVIAGGYAPAGETGPDYAAAEALAIQTIYERNPQRGLVKSKTAEVQVVAGLNYRFQITMTSGAVYDVTVYRDLQGKLSVTNYAVTQRPG